MAIQIGSTFGTSSNGEGWQPLPMDEEALATTSYMARRPCGCFAACITLPDHPKQGGKYNADDRKTLMDWLKSGYIIDRVPDQWISGSGITGLQGALPMPARQSSGR